ncbi:MAG: aldehyde dehydrogenase family protein, partial [SAR324 cluster bacterium]|nr:aldehyde dehydrogenase family protein [SAR324 cluster bacterium]
MNSKFSELIRKQLFIDGQFCSAVSGETLDLINPSTGETITRVDSGNREDIDRAVDVAHRVFQEGPWADLNQRERAKLLFRIADAMEARLTELFTFETLCNGRPVNETRTKLARVPDYFRYFAGLAFAQRSDVVPVEGPYLNYINKVPIGVMGNSSPFN